VSKHSTTGAVETGAAVILGPLVVDDEPVAAADTEGTGVVPGVTAEGMADGVGGTGTEVVAGVGACVELLVSGTITGSSLLAGCSSPEHPTKEAAANRVMKEARSSMFVSKT
jgi:hypothetical protein